MKTSSAKSEPTGERKGFEKKEAKAEVVNSTRQKEATLRPLSEVLSDIAKMYDRDGWLGVQGFSITLRTAHSSSNMNWGDLAIRRRKPNSVP